MMIKIFHKNKYKKKMKKTNKPLHHSSALQHVDNNLFDFMCNPQQQFVQKWISPERLCLTSKLRRAATYKLLLHVCYKLQD